MQLPPRGRDSLLDSNVVKQHLSRMTSCRVDFFDGKTAQIYGPVNKVELAKETISAMANGNHVADVQICGEHIEQFGDEGRATVQRMRDVYDVVCTHDEERGHIRIVGAPSEVSRAEKDLVRYPVNSLDFFLEFFIFII
mgnify:FL=1